MADGSVLIAAARDLDGPAELSADERATLAEAARVLERSTLVGRLSAMAGRPLELVGRALPAPATELISRATELALKSALRVAMTSLGREPSRFRVPRLDNLAAIASGAAGGAIGLASLPWELPVSTAIMLRTIAEIAREEGEDLADPATALACLEVFALGSRTETDDPLQGGYLAVRGMLAKSVGEAARIAAGRGLADRSAPALVRFMAQIASRFGIVVSQKLAAGAVPILGALGGAAVNTAFLEHFRAVARAHFRVRRLERLHGEAAVAAAYDEAKLGLA